MFFCHLLIIIFLNYLSEITSEHQTVWTQKTSNSHWRSSHYAVIPVHNKNSNIQGRSPNVVKPALSALVYYTKSGIKEEDLKNG